MNLVGSTVVIDRPIAACFAFLADPANDVEWRRERVEAGKTSDGPLAREPDFG